MMHAQKALVLGRSPQGERAAVVRFWLRDEGLWAAYVPSLRSAAGGFRPAMVQPLASLELVPGRGRGSLGKVQEARLSPAWRRLHDDPQLQMLVMFTAELLRGVVHEGSASPAFFDDVHDMLTRWDRGESVAHGPVDACLLVCRHLGLELEVPSAEALDGTWTFYPAEGEWAPLGSHSSAALAPGPSAALAQMLSGETLDRGGRNDALDAVLAYLESQHEGWGSLRSVDILRSL